MKIKIDPLDSLFSQVVRARANHTCEYCGRIQNRETKKPKMECSHFMGRRYRHTRYDLENACCLCFECHGNMHEDPKLHTDFFTKRIGSKKLEELRIRANQIWPKVDREKIKTYLQEQLAQMG